MAKKTFKISDIENSQIDVVGGTRGKNVPGSMSLPEAGRDNLEFEISRLKDTTVRLTANDDISFARSDIQEGLSSLERILLPLLDKSMSAEAEKAISGVKEESQRKMPDFEKIKKYLGTLLKIVSLLRVSPETIEGIKAFILSVATKLGIGI